MDAVLHVGPGKMASTTIQKALEEYSPQLYRDGFDLAGDASIPGLSGRGDRNVALCLSNRKDTKLCPNMDQTWRAFTNWVNHEALNRRSIIFSSELMSSPDLDRTWVRPVLRTFSPWKARLTVVVFYRRLFDWLPSLASHVSGSVEHKYRSKWPGKDGGKKINSFLDSPFFKHDTIWSLVKPGRWKKAGHIYSVGLYELYWSELGLANGGEVRILNIHEYEDSVHHGGVVNAFFCHDYVPEATHAC